MINSGPVEVQESKFATRELDHRRSDGIEVTLLWNTRTDDVLVAVDERDGGRFEFTVHPAEALEAFHHPYAYAACDDRPDARWISGRIRSSHSTSSRNNGPDP